MASTPEMGVPVAVCRGASPVSARLPFWQRQFGSRPTLAQKLFDLAAGVMLPVLCIWLDPVVFTGSEPGLGSPFSKYAVGGYTFIFVEVFVLLFWLLLDQRLGIGSGFVGGMLAAGAFFACLLGLAILPLTLLSLILMIPIGVLGLSPFVTSFVFLRNGIRALHGRDASRGARVRWIFAILGAAVAVGAPTVAQREVNRLVYRLAQVNGEESSAERVFEIERVQWVVRWFGPGTVDPLVDAYDREENRIVKRRIADTYLAITGDSIENRLAILRD